MPPRKKDKPDETEPTIFKVRVEPYFAVSVVEGPQHEKFLGRTAREALNRAKHTLVKKGSNDRLMVVNGKAVHAISWANPIYPDDSELLEEIVRITGGVLVE